jgi:hypothetical protein
MAYSILREMFLFCGCVPALFLYVYIFEDGVDKDRVMYYLWLCRGLKRAVKGQPWEQLLVEGVGVSI